MCGRYRFLIQSCSMHVIHRIQAIIISTCDNTNRVENMTEEQGSIRLQILEHLYKECTHDIACEKCFYMQCDLHFEDILQDWASMPTLYRPYSQHPSAPFYEASLEAERAAEAAARQNGGGVPREAMGRRPVPVGLSVVQPKQPLPPVVAPPVTLGRTGARIEARNRHVNPPQTKSHCRRHDVLPALMSHHPIVYNYVPDCALQQLLLATDLFYYVAQSRTWIPPPKPKKKHYSEQQLRSIFYYPPTPYVPPPRPVGATERVPLPFWMTYRL